MCKEHEEMKKELEAMREDVSTTRGEMASLREDVNISVGKFAVQLESIECSLADILTLWKTGTGLVSFVKWLGKIAAAITAIGAAIYMVTHWGGGK